ncbi:MAG: hypothetical protein JSV47_13075 [Deltaproteobacteria bacterium]|nr:MAG: hypothetical protein JSV47_13075 [Deltaproteobacteria bacterium]
MTKLFAVLGRSCGVCQLDAFAATELGQIGKVPVAKQEFFVLYGDAKTSLVKWPNAQLVGIYGKITRN